MKPHRIGIGCLVSSLCILCFSGSAWAETPCGEETCSDGELCAETDEGSRCLSLCRRHEDCESDCCQSIEEPTTAWVCQDAEACVQVMDGDSETSVGEEKCGTTLCKANELCLEYGRNEFCTPRCNADSDCASLCCRAGEDLRRGCVPEGFSCVSENAEEEIPVNKTGDGCRSLFSLSPLVMMAGLLAVLFGRRGRRKRA